jgi:lysophospholipase L1-like esterase
MRKWIIALCAMALGLSAHAQTNAPVGSPPPTELTAATAPNLPESASTTAPDNTRYLNDPNVLKPCQARLDDFDGKPCDIIFIGDSITEYWLSLGKDIWDKNYAPRHALNFGVSGDKTQNVIWRLNNMDIQNLKPKVAVILIGTNNFENTAHDIANGVKQVLFTTQADFPGVKVILVSILPNDRAQEKMKQVNSIIKSFADDSTTYYLDLVPLMPEVTSVDPNGQSVTNWKGLGKDELHPDESGYQIWADAMEPLLTKLLAPPGN